MSGVKAGVAQLVAQATCNRQVVGSSPTTGSDFLRHDQAFSGIPRNLASSNRVIAAALETLRESSFPT